MARKIRTSVGLIGLGIIGKRVAASLRSHGFKVYVWSTSPHSEPNFLGSPAEVAEVCDIIQLFVPDASALFEMLEAMKPQLGPRHLILCNATVGPEATLEAARIVAETGAQMLDAPFTGSKGAAEKGELVYYIGGEDGLLRLAEPVLRASSKAVIKVGKIGEAAVLKLATNMMVTVTVQVLAEALALVRKAGIDGALLEAALEEHAVRSVLTDMKLPKMLESQYEPQFALKHALKDMRLATDLAEKAGLDLPATLMSTTALCGGMERGWGDLDFSAVAKLYEQPDAPALPGGKSIPALEAGEREPS